MQGFHVMNSSGSGCRDSHGVGKAACEYRDVGSIQQNLVRMGGDVGNGGLNFGLV